MTALAVVVDERERRLVGGSRELGAAHPRLDLRALAQDALHQRLGHDQPLAVHAHPRVDDVGMDRQRGVREQRPRRGRPCEQRHALLIADREANVDRGVDHVAIALRHLVRRQRGLAAGAVGDDLEALVEQAAPPDLPQRPPHGLDVVVGERDVGVVGVDPEADPLGEAVPLVDVGEHRLPAALVELGHAVALDVGLARKPELALDLQLDREAVAVPARLAGDEMPAHGLVAGEHVLEHAREDVVRAGPAVGRGRALVEDERRAALAPADRLVEDVAFAPALEYELLELGERLRRIDGTVRAHGGSPIL